MGDVWAWAEIEKAIAERAMRDQAFRAQLVADPKGTLARAIKELTGTEISFPADVTVTVHEETPDSLHLVIPASPAGHRSVSDAELDTVAGGNLPAIPATNHPSQCRTAYWGPASCQ